MHIVETNYQVCNEPAAKHVHYGAMTCFSCRAFFRFSHICFWFKSELLHSPTHQAVDSEQDCEHLRLPPCQEL